MDSWPEVLIYTDGACDPNPGPGGWAAILRAGSREKELKGGDARTTNNRMELQAVIAALETLSPPCRVQLHTDSEYVQRGVTVYLERWKAKGWKTSTAICGRGWTRQCSAIRSPGTGSKAMRVTPSTSAWTGWR